MMSFECGHGDGNLGLSVTLILKTKILLKKVPKVVKIFKYLFLVSMRVTCNVKVRQKECKIGPLIMND